MKERKKKKKKKELFFQVSERSSKWFLLDVNERKHGSVNRVRNSGNTS